MVACARRKILGNRRKAIFHCWTRCVRGAFLCGHDRATGKDFSHRRRWIVTREEQVAGLFAIDIEFRSEMSNHLHLVLRTRPDVARRWSREEVARRWLTATRMAKCMSDDLPAPDPKRVKELAKNKKRIARLRRRLSNVSWLMGLLCENIARRANKEDECRGHFWESRYKCRECTDENAILLCGIYVDLNPIMAGEAKSPETARYTSIFQRLEARGQRANARNRADGWLGVLTWDRKTERDADRLLLSRTGRRASDQGLLSITLDEYLKLLKWTARLLTSGQRQKIPVDLEAILDRLDLEPDAWQETLESYDTSFCHAVGPPASLEKVARRMGVRHLKGISAARRIFR